MENYNSHFLTYCFGVIVLYISVLCLFLCRYKHTFPLNSYFVNISHNINIF